MRKSLFLILILSVFLFNFCSKEKEFEKEQTSQQAYLYEIVCKENLKTKKLYLAERNGAGLIVTKSNVMSDGVRPLADIPDYLLKYLNEYTKPDFPTEWDEFSLCERLSFDTVLSFEEKELVAQTIGIISFAKEELCKHAITKRSEKDKEEEDLCLSQYKQKVYKILMEIAMSTAGGAITGALIGAEVACIVAMYCALDDIELAGIEYIRCTARR